jgi:hypothetical protein
MRRILPFLLSMLSFGATAQTVQTIGAPGTRVVSRGDFQTDSIFYLPRTQVTSRTPFQSGALRYQASDSSLYQWTGTAWRKAGGGTVDSLLFSTRAWRQKGDDSLAALIQVKPSGSGTLNYIPKWTPNGTTLGDSKIYETPGGKIAIGTTTDTASIFNVIGNVRTGSLHVKSTGESIYMSTRSTGVGTSVYINDTSTALTGGGISNSYNTSLGRFSMRFLTTAYNTTGIGYLSLYNVTTGNNNTAVGSSSLSSLNTGGANTAVGYQSLYSTTSGFDNVGIGGNALYGNTTGYYNIAIGNGAMQTGTTSAINIAIGQESMYDITTGDRNVSIGYQSLRLLKTGARNMSIGTTSLYELTTGADNVAIGGNSLFNVKTSNNNVGVGASAGQWTGIAGSFSKGNNNPTNSIFIGRDSRAQDSAQSNQVVIGDQAVGYGSNTATFGNLNIASTYLRGETFVAGDTDNGDYKLQVSGNGWFNGSLTTSDPSGGTKKPWKLGEVSSTSPTSPNRTIRVEIDGTVYYIHAKTTND